VGKITLGDLVNLDGDICIVRQELNHTIPTIFLVSRIENIGHKFYVTEEDLEKV
jgi:hypothetical protein